MGAHRAGGFAADRAGYCRPEAIPIEFSLLRSGMPMGRTRSAACFVRKMAERAGRKFCSKMKIRERSIWHSNPAIQKQYTPRSGRREDHRGAFTRLRTGRAAGSIARMTVAITGNKCSGHGLPSEGLGRIGIAFAPSNPRRIYLIVDAKEGGLYRSDNGGQSWQRVSDDKRVWGRGWYFGEVSVDPKNPDTVYLPNTTAYQSRDGGKTFTAFKGAPGRR